MKQWPSRFDIFFAECQVMHTKLVARERLAQVRSAIRLRLMRPSTLVVVTSLGIVLGVWFARREKPRVQQSAVSRWTSVLGLVPTLLNHVGLQGLAGAWARLRHPDSATK